MRRGGFGRVPRYRDVPSWTVRLVVFLAVLGMGSMLYQIFGESMLEKDLISANEEANETLTFVYNTGGKALQLFVLIPYLVAFLLILALVLGIGKD
ncbi:hypothetical protein DRP04_03695 [Archaeoglobales archaeon]|nr:MAG: hypothetical protein DRP04_03695 [Archaeoglobales archaeon]